jgi:hypothetical protein
VCVVWCSCVQLTNTYLGDLVSTYFIQQAFAGNSMVRFWQRFWCVVIVRRHL